MNIEEIKELINKHPDLKLLVRLSDSDINFNEDSEIAAIIGVLDLETTGLNHKTDEVIEIGIVKAGINSNAEFVKIISEYEALLEPSEPITKEITNINGITNEMVKGKTLDKDGLDDFVSNIDFMVAHNAGFDRPFAENLSKTFESINWICSQKDCNWHAEGFESSKLESLNNKYGVFYDGHRAVIDCMATIHVLSKNSKHGGTMLASAIKNARLTTYELFAENTPYSSKDTLYDRNYTWNPEDSDKPKSWSYTGEKEAMLAERDFLTDKIYQFPKERFKIAVYDASIRYSSRLPTPQSVTLDGMSSL